MDWGPKAKGENRLSKPFFKKADCYKVAEAMNAECNTGFYQDDWGRGLI